MRQTLAILLLTTIISSYGETLVIAAEYKDTISYIDEVSIGHALVSDALYYGLENTIQMYLQQLA